MYEAFFGLAKRPFSMTADPEFLFLSSQHREALAGITYAMLDRKGLAVVTADAGMGKTTLLMRALKYLSGTPIRSSLILHPTLTTSEFLEMILLAFGMQEIPESKTMRLIKLRQFLSDSDREQGICALAVDEAHKLSPELFEEIRLLGNLECGGRKLLQIILLGQTELTDLLNRPDFRQVKQRIAVRININPLSEEQVGEYIRYRWEKAGGKEFPLAPDALLCVVQHAQGIPRVVNAVCDNSLLLAFSGNSTSVHLSHVQEACTDLDLCARVAPVLQAPRRIAPAIASERPILPSLERYQPSTNHSRIARWASRLKLA